MYYYGGGSCGCGNYMPYPCYGQSGNGGTSYYAIVLVLFILLVIVIGSHFTR